VIKLSPGIQIKFLAACLYWLHSVLCY